MGRGSNRQFKDKAKTRVDDLQGMFADIQSARIESRAADAAVLEEQVHQMLREWKAELNEPSPACSLLGNSQSANLSSEIRRMLQLSEEHDDATSKLAEPAAGVPELHEGAMNAGNETAGYQQENSNSSSDISLQIRRMLRRYEEEDVTSKQADLLPTDLKPESYDILQPDVKCAQGGGIAFQQDYYLNQGVPDHEFLDAEQYQETLPAETHLAPVNYLEGAHLEYHQFELSQNQCMGFDTNAQHGGSSLPHISDLFSTMCPSASAFLRPKCALWDCPRPSQASEWCQDYCSRFHAEMAYNEGPPGMAPVLRPGGIDLKDGPLFAALSAKIQGKNVGIPECEGSATGKSPWNAPDLFDLSLLEGETLREWLFFDKPRRAFETGNRKQRSLSDYKGRRGWHESRKQVMKEFGGLKRSYYMDPQPPGYLEWHLFEYEINGCNVYALYRLEVKLVDGKKTTKVKVTSDSLVDLQQQMGRLNAEGPDRRSVKGRAKASQKDNKKNITSATDIVLQKDDTQNIFQASDQSTPVNQNPPAYGPSLTYAYSAQSFDNYYGT